MRFYRYGFNGKDSDSEIKGVGNSVDFGARMYDPRLGRWLSVDKKFQNLPFLNPFNFGADNPITYNEPDENTEFYFNGKWIGSNDIDNGLIGIIKNKSVKKDIVKNATYSIKIESGRAFEGSFAIHYSDLKASVRVLNIAINNYNEGNDRKNFEILDQKHSGDYSTKENEKGDSPKSFVNKASVVIPIAESNALIHSNPLTGSLEFFANPKGYTANEPSPSRADGTSDYKLVFKIYHTNAIVGKMEILNP